jgi:polysaccharide export outer membrane protein
MMKQVLVLLGFVLLVSGCVAGSGQVVRVESQPANVEDELSTALDETELQRIQDFKKSRQEEVDPQLSMVAQGATRLTAREYAASPEGKRGVSREYRVGGNDVLSVLVYEEKDLSRESIRVTSDGCINFPLIGTLSVAGKTTAQIEQLISDKLTEQQYLIKPHVGVKVQEFLSKKVLVMGSIEEPGTYFLHEEETVLDLISRAGGVDFAEGANRINILRVQEVDGQDKKFIIDINLRLLLQGSDPVSNLLLKNKDIINIPKADKIFVIGQVNEPGDYILKDRDIGIVEAIGMAGGFTRIAAANRVHIIRTEDGVDKKYTVNVDMITEEGKKGEDIVLKPNDVIVVPESYF